MTNEFTPLHLQILLHYHCSPEEYAKDDERHRTSEAVKEYTDDLRKLDLIERSVDGAVFQTTERGNAYVRGICSVPLPIQRWVIE